MIAFLIIQRDHSFVLLAETILLLGQINWKLITFVYKTFILIEFRFDDNLVLRKIDKKIKMILSSIYIRIVIIILKQIDFIIIILYNKIHDIQEL
jgi:hypothetical protein